MHKRPRHRYSRAPATRTRYLPARSTCQPHLYCRWRAEVDSGKARVRLTHRLTGALTAATVLNLSALVSMQSAGALPTITSGTTTGHWVQAAELAGSGGVPDFGASIAISGGVVVVGAPGGTIRPGGSYYSGPSKRGRAYVFTKGANGWHQTAELTGSDTVLGDNFGYSVAVSDDTVVVGAYSAFSGSGRAYVFTKGANGWHQTAELRGSDTGPGDSFGYSVAVSGSTVVVGAPYSGGVTEGGSAGRAYVFTNGANGWHQAAELTGPAPTTSQLCMLPGDEFGNSVAVSGETAVVGACGQAMAGRAYVFTKGPNGWHQTADLKGSDTARDDGFGWSVALSGGTAVVGAPGHARRAGRVYVFTNDGTGWYQVAELAGQHFFGGLVAVSGGTIVASTQGSPAPVDVFTKGATGWLDSRLVRSHSAAGELLKSSVAVSGDMIGVGAELAGIARTGPGYGLAYLFKYLD